MSELYTPELFEDLIEDLYPLSPMQQGMLFHSLTDPAAGAYFQQLICTVAGQLDHAAFQQAWQQVVQRHPALRTAFLWEELDTPVQAVFPAIAMPLIEQDWRDRSADEQAQALDSYLEHDRRQGFDLADAPLLRLALFRLDDVTTQFVWSYHHALIDGWSVMHVLRDVATAYSAATGGYVLNQLPPRPYREYIAWLQQQDLASAETFWRDLLAGLTAPTTTGIERVSEPGAGAEPYADLTLELSEELTQELSQLARRYGLTLNTVIQGAWALLLSRYSDEESVLFGAVTAGRPASLPDADQMVGLFTNILPVAVDVTPDAPLRSWLMQIQSRQAEAQEYAYPSLRQIQQWSEIPGGTPLFESIVVFENYPGAGELSAPDSALTIQDIRAVERTHYPLNLVVIPGVRLRFQLTYAEQRFDAANIRRCLDHLEQILLAVSHKPEQRLREIALNTPAEREQLRAWNATAAPLPLDRSLAQIFTEQAAQTPDAPVVIWRDTTLSYRAVNEQANRLAHLLRERGLGTQPEQPVAVLLPRSPETLIALLAIWKAGGVYVPLDPATPAAYQQTILADIAHSLLITTGDLAATLEQPGLDIVHIERDAATLAQQPSTDLSTPLLPEQATSLMYTSGSTGQPKGIVLTHAQIVKRLAWMWDAYPFDAGEIGCQRSTMSFSVTLWELLGAPLKGYPIVIVPEAIANEPEQLIDTLATNQVSRITVVPSLLRLILESPRDLATQLARLKLWTVLGEPLPLDLAHSFARRLPHATLLNQFGSSETLDATCFDTHEQPDDVLSVLIGRPIANTAIYLLDTHMQPVPIGLPGEIYVGSAALARGYLNQPELTAEKFVPNPFGEPGSRLYRMGDLARYRIDGTLEHVGRKDHQVKVRGVRLELNGIEALLLQHPAVDQAAAVLHDMGNEQRLIAYVVVNQNQDAGCPLGMAPGTKNQEPRTKNLDGEQSTNEQANQASTDNRPSAIVTNAEAGGGSRQGLGVKAISEDLSATLRAFMRKHVPEALVPSTFIVLDELPLTPNGKIDRLQLPEPELRRSRPDTAVHQPQTHWEQAIAAIWQDLLPVEHVGLDDNFFDLGGHSLLAIQAHARLQEALDRPLSITDLFRYPTIRALAAYLGDDSGALPQVEAAARRDDPAASAVPTTSDIAIIALAGRFPGAATLDAFWRNLAAGSESISFFSDDALLAAGVDPALLSNPSYVKAGGALDGIELFDAAFFGYTPREAAIMDPQQRLLLEVAWEALERAGYDSERYPGRIGLFAGVGSNTYLMFNLLSQPDLLASVGAMPTQIANEKDFATTRVAYKLNLSGPSVTVQTACSTSLVATHLACRSLLSGEADIVLAGGASVNPLHRSGYLYTPGSIVSPDGHCRAFDADAQGSIFGSGLGLIVLKRLDDALRDGDTIHAVIKGSAINNDGAAKVGYTAPSVERQAEVIAAAQRQAGIDPATIGYVEAHGSGTSLGDPIEVTALTHAFRQQTDARGFCALGSVKTNIGHLDAAAGAAGLIKTVLSLQHHVIPPSLNFERANPAIDFATSPFYVNTQATPWPQGSTPRRAGVSSFGIGGTNAHIVLEEAPATPPSDPTQPWQILMLSAKTGSALDTATANLATFLAEQPEANLADVAYTLQLGRRTWPYRRALVSQSLEQARQSLAAGDSAQLLSAVEERRDRPVVFMFAGLGDQYPQLAAGLYQTEPVFRAEVDRCCDLLLPLLDVDLREIIYPQGFDDAQEHVEAQPTINLRQMLGRDEPASDAESERLRRTIYAQPALFVIEYALAQLWISWGLRPSALIGYSLGEYVAACLAGVFSLEDGLALVAERAQLVERVESGAMLAVALAEAQLTSLLDDEISLAAINGPALCVLAGSNSAIDALEARLTDEQIVTRRLSTTHAFHSAIMQPLAEELTARVRQITLNPPAIPYISNVTGTWISKEEALDPDYWARHLCQPVRFSDGLQRLIEERDRVLLEVGPGRFLSSLALQHASGSDADELIAIPSLRHSYEQRADRAVLLEALAQLWLVGVAIDWPQLHVGQRRSRIPLPTYPFERQRYWIEPQARAATPPMIRSLDKQPDIADWFYIPSWKRSLPPTTDAHDDPAQPQHWLIFADELEIADALAPRLAEAGHTPTLVLSSTGFERLADDRYTLDPQDSAGYHTLIAALREQNRMPQRIAHLWSLSADAQPNHAQTRFEPTQQHGFYSLLFLIQAIGAVKHTEPLALIVVTNHAQRVGSDDQLAPATATMHALSRVIPQEYPQIMCRSVDLALPASASLQSRLVDQLLTELLSGAHDLAVAYRGRDRWVETYERAPLAHQTGRPICLRERGVYAIVGALENIGMLAATYLAQAVSARLVLTVKPEFPVPSRDSWDSWLASHDADEYISKGIVNVRQLEAAGAEVLVVNADVTDLDAIRMVIAQTHERFGALDGVIYAAGLFPEESLRAIADTGYTECSWHFQPRAHGVYVLEQALADEALDFCLLISSLSGVVGGVGFAGYAATATFMDAFAQRHNQTEDIPWSSVDWHGVSDRETLEVFQRIFSVPLVDQLIVSTSDLEAMLDTWIRHPAAPAWTNQPTEPASADNADYRRSRLRNEYVAPRSSTEQTLAELWHELLGIDEIGVNDNFFALGGDSLLGIQLVARAKQADLQLSIKELFQNPTIAELAALSDDGDAAQGTAPKRTIQELAIAARQAGQQPAESVADTPSPSQELVLGPVPLMHHSLIFLDVDHANHHHWNIAFLLAAQQRLDPTLLAEVVTALLHHHDALRLRLTRDGHAWSQYLSADVEPLPITWIDLASVPVDQHAARIEAVASEQQRNLNLFTGPVFTVTAFAAEPPAPDHLLLIVHHLVADAFSLRVLLADCETAYRQRLHGLPIALPPKTTSIQAWAQRLHDFAQSDALRTDLDYWRALPWHDVAPIPMDHPQRRGENTLASQQTVWVALTAEETHRLREELVPLFQVSVQDVLLAAIARVIARWSGSNVVSLDLLHHGRNALLEGMDLSRTVGLIATGIPILLDLRTATTPEAALRAIPEQFGQIPHQGLTHSLLSRITEDAEITEALRSMPRRDIFFNYLGQNHQTPDPERLLSPVEAPIGPKQDPQTDRGFLLAFTGVLADQELRLNIGYSTAVHAPATIEHLAHACVEELRGLLQLVSGHPGRSSGHVDRTTSADESPIAAEIVTGPVPLMHNSIVFLEVDHRTHHHWNIAFLLQAQPKLDRVLLAEVVTALEQHHDALRLRFTRDGAHWTQRLVPPADEPPITWIDLASVPVDQHAAQIETIADQQQRRLNLFTGPVFSVTVFATGPNQPDRLLLIVHHLVADAFSMRILLADFETAYRQRLHNLPIALPPKTTSIQAWAQRLYDFAQSDALRTDLDYWRALPWHEMLPIPMDHPEGRSGNTFAAERRFWVSLTSEETHTLHEQLLSAYGVSVQEVLLAAIAAAIAAWKSCRLVSADVLNFGREPLFADLDLSRTVGYLTMGTVALLDLRAAHTPDAILTAVRDQLRAIPHQGLSHSLLDRVTEDAEVAAIMESLPLRDTFFNYMGHNRPTTNRASLFQPVQAALGEAYDLSLNRGIVLAFTGMIADEQLQVRIDYSSAIHEAETIEALVSGFSAALRRFIRHYQEQHADDQAQTETVNLPVALMPNMHRSFETVDPERHIWNISTLLKVSVPLDPGRLQEALRIVLARHDALRLRSVQSETGWQQYIAADAEEIPFTRIDLATVPPDEQTAEIESLATMLQASLDITNGPLLRIAQFELRPGQPGRLLILVHHTVCDGYAWQIILDDLFRAYNQLSEGRAPLLPPLTTSYQEYTECAAAYAGSSELHAELDYWRSALAGAVTPLPVDYPGGQHTGASARRLSVTLTVDETDALLAQSGQISVNEALLTALAMSFEHWTSAPTLLIDMVRHGRHPVFGPLDLSRTVGWFDYLVPLRLPLRSSSSAEATAHQIRTQLQEIPHDGMGYGLLRYLSPDADVRAALQAAPSPQVLFNYRGQIVSDTSRIALPIQAARESAGRDHSSQVIRPHLLLINAQIASRQLEIHWEYSEQVHRRKTIERLTNDFIAILRSFSLKHHSR